MRMFLLQISTQGIHKGCSIIVVKSTDFEITMRFEVTPAIYMSDLGETS